MQFTEAQNFRQVPMGGLPLVFCIVMSEVPVSVLKSSLEKRYCYVMRGALILLQLL